MGVMKEKDIECPSCDTKYSLMYEDDIEPIVCPFCGETTGDDENALDVDLDDWDE